MAVQKRKLLKAYGLNGFVDVFPQPIVTTVGPVNGTDGGIFGQMWINSSGNDVYILSNEVNKTWSSIGGGSPTFDTLTVTGATDLQSTVAIGGVLTLSASGRGMLQSSAAGVVSEINGTNGQVIIGATGADAAWATIASADGTVIFTAGANTLDLSVPAVPAGSFDTDAGSGVPVAGVLNVLGGTNANTAGAGNTVTINVDNAPTFSGLVTAQAGFTQSAGTATIVSDTNAAQAIYIHTNGGVNEQIDIHVDQGSATNSLRLRSDVGGIFVDSGLAGAQSVRIDASNAAGGLDFNAGTGGIAISAVNGTVALESGTGAMNIGADAAAHTVTVGSTTGASATVIQAGSGALDIDAAGIVSINSSAAVINVGNDAVAQNINIGTGGAERTITIGNATGATALALNAGTGAVQIGANATAHATTVGSTTGASASTLQAGSGALTVNGGGVVDIDAVGALSLNSSGAAINMGNDNNAFAINIGTGGAERTITIGNGTAATSVVINSGTGNLDLGVNATDHTSRLGSTNGVSATTIQAGTGAMTFTAGGAFDVNAVGNITIDSSGGTIGIGEDAIAQAINIGTGAAARTVTIGNATGATAVNINCGTGGVSVGASANAHTSTFGSTTGASDTVIQAGTGGLSFEAAGIVSMVPATDSATGPAATAAVTINANVGVATLDSYTQAAGATLTVTVTNSVVTAASAILVSASNLGANDAQMTVTRVKPGAGTFDVILTNNGAAALNGDVILTFWVIAA